MKIGILTFHRGLNHGGFLQAYGMQAYLESLGHDAWIVDYQNPRHRWQNQVFPWIIPQRPATWWKHFQKWRAFHADFRLLKVTPPVRDAADTEKLGLDVIIVGSDIVWNLELFGVDLMYFADVQVPCRIAYAPSFGWMPEDFSLPLPVMDCLEQFHSIFVRDQQSKVLLKNNLGTDFPMVVDPTLLQPAFGNFADPPPTRNLLVYAHGLQPDWREMLTDFAGNNDLDLFSTGYPTGLPGKLSLDLGPLAWTKALNHASVIVTNTFHGTIYATLSGRPFVSIRKEQSASRIESYLEQIGCPERLLNSPDTALDLLKQPPPAMIRESIQTLSSSSRTLFEQALADCEHKTERGP